MGRRREDHWARRAKAERFRARSAYKLLEIDERHRLLRRGCRVLDLGCAPGSWLQVAAERVGPEGRIVGVDLKPVEFVAANVTTLQADALGGLAELDADAGLPTLFDVVLSDMAPNTSGIKEADHYRSVELARAALEQAWRRSNAGASLVMKLFQGPDMTRFLKEVKARYRLVTATRPDSTRSESREIFVIARDRRAEQIFVG